MFHEMPLKMYFMKYSERKVSQCILAFTPCDLQNSQILTYEGCFGFHRVANAKDSRLYERERNIP